MRHPTSLALAALLAGCTALHPARPPVEPPSPPAAWQAPLPHGGRSADLTRWWQQFDDPLLPALVDAAQAASPTLASAASRLTQARAAATAAGAALVPRLDGTNGAVRARSDVSLPIATRLSSGFAAAWEPDVFGAATAARDAARARAVGAGIGWHEARVLVASETAQQYVALRACEAQFEQAQADAASRGETARLSALTERAGFQSPANAALARASAAQARSTAEAQRAACEGLVKSLVELTALDETVLRRDLARATGRLPRPAGFEVPAVPAHWLQQRPDLARAALEAGAAAAEVAQARAQRLPAIALTGSVDRSRVTSSGFTQTGDVWALGPLQVTLPVFDAGRRVAAEQAAHARYDEAAALYRARLRTAVREVEEALVALDSTQRREADVRAAAEGFELSLRGTETRYRSGLASLFELEDARRSAVQARAGVVELERQRLLAWIALYKAVGGGWSPATAAPR